jgi:hypothetical protein
MRNRWTRETARLLGQTTFPRKTGHDLPFLHRSAFLLMNFSYLSMFPICLPAPRRYILIQPGFAEQPDESAGDRRALCAAGAAFAR